MLVAGREKNFKVWQTANKRHSYLAIFKQVLKSVSVTSEISSQRLGKKVCSFSTCVTKPGNTCTHSYNMTKAFKAALKSITIKPSVKDFSYHLFG